ncbi:MAG: thiolase family protein [Pseudomonadota bacterium]|jgi:acetyl-CoA C-acetyltransferase|nr:thiolase family protein [Alphaproteobacteria bacterium]
MIGIHAATRTAIGSFQGQLSSYSATDLGSFAIRAALASANLKTVDEVFMGCVLQAGLGQAPARQASIKAGLGEHVPTTTINKVCGSGMRAVMFACDSLRLGHIQTAVAGGMESMTNAPYALEKARSGYRFGHGNILDLMLHDGLEDAYHKNAQGGRCAMGVFADNTAKEYAFSRSSQEDFAHQTYENALAAQQSGAFNAEISSITFADKKGETLIDKDEQISRVKPEKFAVLKPAFGSDGTVTAATSSSLADGAAALVLSSQTEGALAKIMGYTSFSQTPETFTTAPIGAIKKLCDSLNWSLDSIDAFEINEAFAVVPMAVMKSLNIPRTKINMFGGACALGHPIGASGARIIVTLLNVMRQKNLRRSIAAACIGGGEATAVALEI